MTTAPTGPTLPGQNVAIDNNGDQVNPIWYGYFSALKKIYDYVATLQPLSDLPAHDDTKSDVLRVIATVTGTAHTLDATEAGKIVRFKNASAQTVTIPLNSAVALTIGFQIDWIQAGAGKLTFAESSGVTVNASGNDRSAANQYAGGTLVKIDTNEWDLVGNLDT